jgi:hypothetical protein
VVLIMRIGGFAKNSLCVFDCGPFQKKKYFYRSILKPVDLLLAYLTKVGLCGLHPVCVSVYHPYQILNA